MKGYDGQSQIHRIIFMRTAISHLDFFLLGIIGHIFGLVNISRGILRYHCLVLCFLHYPHLHAFTAYVMDYYSVMIRIYTNLSLFSNVEPSLLASSALWLTKRFVLQDGPDCIFGPQDLVKQITNKPDMASRWQSPSINDHLETWVGSKWEVIRHWSTNFINQELLFFTHIPNIITIFYSHS